MWIAADLHAHSYFSDGVASPDEVVWARAQAGLSLIALSDHDILAGVPQAAAAAQRAGLCLLPAMEATAFFHFGQSNAEQVHILAYFPPAMLADGRLGQTFLYRRGLRVQSGWRDFICAWLDELQPDDRRAINQVAAGDSDETLGPLRARSPALFPGLQTMIRRICARRPQLFRHFIRSHVRFWEEDRALFGWSPEELIDAIRADGAVDIVAHPARYRDKERLARVLLGASGVEAYTSRHRPEWAAQFRRFAESHGKLWTASTDDHQKPDAAYQPPPCPLPAATVERLLGQPLSSFPSLRPQSQPPREIPTESSR
jgi:hypothetical protein